MAAPEDFATDALPSEAVTERRPRRRPPWFSIAGLTLLLLLIAAAFGIAKWIDTESGHRFLISRVASLQPSSGLRITIGSIKGSIYKRAQLRDVRFSDAKGQFARIADADLSWYPLAWFSNRLDIDWLHIGSAELARLPQLTSTGAGKSILPGFDIRLMSLRVDRLAIGAAVSGKPHVVQARGRADIRSGRAVISLKAYALDSADGIRIALDSRPDDDKFDVDAVASAPAGGLIAGIIGVKEPLALAIRGNGSWKQWRGRVIALRGTALAANLALTAKEGQYGLRGTLPLVGPLSALGQGTAPIDADLTFEQRVIAGRVNLAVRGLKLGATGGVDLGRNRFDNLIVDARVDNLAQLSPSLTGRNAWLTARLSGAFDSARIDYMLTAPEVRQGKIALVGLKLVGDGRLVAGGGSWPVKLTANAIRTGTPSIDQRLRMVNAEGVVRLADGKLKLGPMALNASGLTGRIEGEVTPSNGALALTVAADMRGLELQGLGRVDVGASLKLNRPVGRALGVDGTVKARLTRFDNSFLRTVAGGLPTLTSKIGFGTGGRLLFQDLRVVAPALTLAGSGDRESNGDVHLTGTGNHRVYGPVHLKLDGNLSRPRVELLFDRPNVGGRLSAVNLLLEPDDAGYAFRGNGQSMLGPFTAHGAIRLPRGADVGIDVTELKLGDILGTGTLTPVTGGIQGRLILSGPADGSIQLDMVDGAQHAVLDVDLGGARFAGTPQISVNRGQIKADLLLREGATTIKGEVQARGVRYGSLRIGRLTGNADLINGTGTAQVIVTGGGGRTFNLTSKANIAPDRISIDLSGTLDRQPLKLNGPAVIAREDDGWRLMPSTLSLRSGSLKLAAFMGAESTHVDAEMRRLPLSLLDLVNGDLGLGGTADGTLKYDQPRGGVPAGQLNLRVHGLTRSGLALSSNPIDIGVNAILNDQRGAVRAVIADGGKITGRAQALVTPFGPGSLVQRLNAAPLQAQLRYAGGAETLWRLTNIELFSLGGQMNLSANVGGTLADPQIRGTLATQNATLQSPATGMSLTGVSTNGSFNGAELTLADLKGQTAGGGKVAGTARFTFSGERGIGMDINLQADRAVVLDRDDVGATVTGPLRIQSDGSGGVISGDLNAVASRFTLGRAAAVAEIPQLRLIEINRQGEEIAPARQNEPWRLDINAKARESLKVEGLGMESVWSADLKITGAVTSPVFKGTANLVSGSYDFAGKRFDLREGRLTFNGNTPVNPTLDIRAVADLSNVNATINVTGTSLRPIIAFSSTSGLPQDELLSRVLFGTSVTNLSAPEALQLASAVTAFQGGGSGLDPINAVRRATGLSRLRIIGADTTTGQKTSIAAGKNVTRNLYVELITDGQGYSATRVEYQITRWLSLLSTVSSIGRQSVSGRVSKDY
jgi:translocation and assembly module TamB